MPIMKTQNVRNLEHREYRTWEHKETHGRGHVECKTQRTQEKGTHITKVHKS